MKKLKPGIVAILVATFSLSPFVSLAADKDAKPTPYPLKKCVVSGDKLGEMGKPVVYVYEGREIKFCCKDCIKDFKKDPAKYLKKIDQEAAKEKKASGT